MKKTTFLIVGKHAVLEALKNPNRKIDRVFLTEDAQKKLNRDNAMFMAQSLAEYALLGEKSPKLKQLTKKQMKKFKASKLEKKYSSPRSNMVFTLGGMVDRENTTANSNSSTIGSRESREQRRPTVTMFSIGGEGGGDDNDDDELTETSGRI